MVPWALDFIVMFFFIFKVYFFIIERIFYSKTTGNSEFKNQIGLNFGF